MASTPSTFLRASTTPAGSILLTLLAGTPLLADQPGCGTFTYSIDGGPEVAVSIPFQVGSTGQAFYTTTIQSGTTTILPKYTASLETPGLATISGECKVINGGASARIVRGAFLAPLVHPLGGDVLVGGVASLVLSADAGGGVLSCAPGADFPSEAFAACERTAGLFFCPAALGLTGAGTISTSTTFGVPIPTLMVPFDVDRIGHRFGVTITGGDAALVKLGSGYSGVPGPAICRPDLDGDGNVGPSDLSLLLASWGATSSCADRSDLDCSGTIDIGDLAQILGAWGVCSP